MIEAILEKIEAKPDLQVLKLVPEEAKALHEWLKKYHYAADKLPPFEVWIQKSSFLGRLVEVVELPKPPKEGEEEI